MIDIKAEFLKSSQKPAQLPADNLPEYAFVGRSNVGKSSLINLLTGRKNLAKTSGKPGKTRLINHFTITNPSDKEQWFLVDLPGYGYARVSKSAKKVFQKFITEYFRKRRQLVCGFVLVDIRHEPQKVDLEFMQWLGENQIPFCIIFTKADKLRPSQIDKHVENYKAKLLEDVWEEMPQYFVTSSSKAIGRDEVLNFIGQINQDLKN